jgi:RHS repeat-associated protein
VYLHADHLNTARLATDENKTVLWRWESEAFGATAPNEDPDGDHLRITLNLRFPGQYADTESGLYYNRNRYYDPKTGRYITSDPVGLRGSRNPYSYVGSNPTSRIDPTGLQEVFPIPLPRPVPIPMPRPIPAPIDPALPPATGPKDDTKEHCTRLFIRCAQEGWGGDWTCAQCHFFCTGMNEYWPFEHCSPDLMACRQQETAYAATNTRI